MINKQQARIIVEDNWGRKKYLQGCDSDTIKDLVKVRLTMWQMNCNYKSNDTDIKFPLCKKLEDTTEHVAEYEKAHTQKRKQQGRMGRDNKDLQKK